MCCWVTVDFRLKINLNLIFLKPQLSACVPEGNPKEKLCHDLVALNRQNNKTNYCITDIVGKQNMLSVNVLPTRVPMNDQNHRQNHRHLN